jgi:hypothetical protein
MRRSTILAAFFLGILLLGAFPLNGGEWLRMKVSPAVSIAPGFLTVRVSVQAADDNRRLTVVAESSDFFRSSEVQLDGAHASPLNVFEFRNLPTGTYEVTSVLVGPNGPRATISQRAQVEPFGGR